MATNSPVLGKSMKIKIGSPTATVIMNLQSNSLSHVSDVAEATTKSSGDYKEYKATFKDMTMDFDGVANGTAGTNGIEELHEAVGTEVSWEYGDDVVGHRKITGTGILLNVDEDAPHDDLVTFSGSIQNTGDPVFGTYSA